MENDPTRSLRNEIFNLTQLRLNRRRGGGRNLQNRKRLNGRRFVINDLPRDPLGTITAFFFSIFADRSALNRGLIDECAKKKKK